MNIAEFEWESDGYTTEIEISRRNKATIHQVTTVLATSKNVLFPGHNTPANHWYWWPDTLLQGDN